MTTGASSNQPTSRLADLEVGQVVAERVVPITRETLVRYAGASGDFNPIHYDDELARSVGLPGVIAHGMLTMGSAITILEDWLGDLRAVREYQVRFTRPVPVPGIGQAHLQVTATIGALDADAGTARIDLAATCGQTTVLGRARAVIALGEAR